MERLENDLDEHKMEVDSLMEENDGLIKEKEELIKRLNEMEKRERERLNRSEMEGRKRETRNIGVNTSPRKEKTREDTNEPAESPPPRMVMRPALKGISKLVPTMPKLPRDKLDEIQEDMVRHLETIYKLREELDSNAGNVHVKDTSRKEEWPLSGPSKNKGIKLIENIQLVPPKAGPTIKPDNSWVDVGKGGKVKKQRSEEKKGNAEAHP